MSKKNPKKIFQSELFQTYIEKWRKILYSTSPIDFTIARELIKQAYNLLNFKEPEILLFSSPLQARTWFVNNIDLISLSDYVPLKYNLIKLIENYYFQYFRTNFYAQFTKLDDLFYQEQDLFAEICYVIEEPIYEILDKYGNYWTKVTETELLSTNLVDVDYLLNRFNLSCDRVIWNALISLAEKCPYTFALTNTCIVIQRPNLLYLDSKNRLHAEGKPAVSFTDGYEIYVRHGIVITEAKR